MHEVAKLGLPAEFAPVTMFGASVAISADGNTIAVGAPRPPGPEGHGGEIVVYKRPAGGWVTGMTPTSELSDGSAELGLGGEFTHLGELLTLAPNGSWVAGLEGLSGDLSPTGIASVIAVFDLGPGDSTGFATEHLGDESGDSGGFTSLTTNAAGTSIFAGDPFAYGGTGRVLSWNSPNGQWTDSDKLDPRGIVNGQDAELDPGLAIATHALTGLSIAASGDQLVAGAPEREVGGEADAGAGYVFTEPADSWHGVPDYADLGSVPTGGVTPTATLTASTPQQLAELGFGAGFSGDAIALAARGETVGTNKDQGEVYAYDEPPRGWEDATEAFTLTASNGAEGDELGSFVGGVAGSPYGTMVLSGSTAVVGAPHQGKPAYVFSLDSTLAVNVTGTGSGSVTGTGSGDATGGGISCPSSCSTSVARGGIAQSRSASTRPPRIPPRLPTRSPPRLPTRSPPRLLSRPRSRLPPRSPPLDRR